jgi:CheY-like chemotaxis protein
LEYSNSHTILLVEDEVIIGMATKSNLESLGYKTVLATSSDNAIRIAMEEPAIDLVLMDIDLGKGLNGIETCKVIIEKKYLPIVFVSSHTEKSVVSLTEDITSFGYIVKSSHLTVYDASIKMAYKLFDEKSKREKFDKYLRCALNYEDSPIFISNEVGNVIFCNRAYLDMIGAVNYTSAIEFEKYIDYVKVFSNCGDLLNKDDWANKRGLRGLENQNEIFYVYNIKINQIQVNCYSYAPIIDEDNKIIGSYVKIGDKIENPDDAVLAKIKCYI